MPTDVRTDARSAGTTAGPTDGQGAKRSHFRPDIQGLRALAVGVVILAHCGFATVSGGFVGVDVFFVISGFLITSLLVREAGRTGRISLLGFYARRARRILPAATLVLVATVVASLLFLPLVRAAEIIKDSIWAAAFGANIRFAARRHRLLRQGRARLPAPALLVAVGGGAVLPGLAAAPGRLAHLGAPARPRRGSLEQPPYAAAAGRRAERAVVRLVDLRDVRVADHGLLLHPDPRVGARRRRRAGHLHGPRAAPGAALAGGGARRRRPAGDRGRLLWSTPRRRRSPATRRCCRCWARRRCSTPAAPTRPATRCGDPADVGPAGRGDRRLVLLAVPVALAGAAHRRGPPARAPPPARHPLSWSWCWCSRSAR